MIAEALVATGCDRHNPTFGVQALIDVAEVFGESWTTAKAVPLVLRQLQEQFYLFRITCMQVWSACNDRACFVLPTSQALVRGMRVPL